MNAAINSPQCTAINCTANQSAETLINALIDYRADDYNYLINHIQAQIEVVRYQIAIYEHLQASCTCCKCQAQCHPCLTFRRSCHYQRLCQQLMQMQQAEPVKIAQEKERQRRHKYLTPTRVPRVKHVAQFF